MIAVYIVIGIVALLIALFVLTFNGLVRLRNQVRNAWAQTRGGMTSSPTWWRQSRAI